ncbi:MarR family winged helix-turn-helix transcriptional regulator [Sphingomonas quercus]|uniref:MarR family transcriptional regulator n=1 Tax=Sphingomonas quercus TaxID=2842451 RepID=A0ABS6BIZ1_9SPHN|nr:MarR family transcriptional regulator [Sphingomonas quercus]MBU3077786.1 MarR family transcriptional regulator [Sphingomonas quercus]
MQRATDDQDERQLILADFIPYRLSIATHLVSHAIARAYETRFGLGIPQWRVVAVLAESGPLMSIDVAQRTRMDKMTVSRAAAALVDRRLLVREANPGDRRSHLLSLSREGEDLYAEVAPAALRLEQQLLDGCSDDEVAGFVAMLHRLEQAAAALINAGLEPV